MREGLILNVSDYTHTRLEWRAQVPCFELDDGMPVFEAWYWHVELRRWFVMSCVPDSTLQAQGVVFFRPNDPVGLRRILTEMGTHSGLL